MNITLTGADNGTKIEDLISIANIGAEIGFLYTHSPDGRMRYPHWKWIVGACEAVGKRRSAIHVCGGRAREKLMRGELNCMFEVAHRVQVNGAVSSTDLLKACDMYPENEVITQHTAENAILVGLEIDNHQLLVDGSGGRGKSPEKWERPADTIKPVGFAGGLGPDNLRDELPKIMAVAKDHPWWVDMEGKLRDDDDLFSVEKATVVMKIWREWCGK